MKSSKSCGIPNTFNESGASTSAAVAGQSARLLKNWAICKIYAKAIKEGLLVAHRRQWLAERYGVEPHYISNWKVGSRPKSWKTYQLSIDPERHTGTVPYLREKHSLSETGVRTTLRALDIEPVTLERESKTADKIKATDLAGKAPDHIVGELADCSASAVFKFRKKNNIPAYVPPKPEKVRIKKNKIVRTPVVYNPKPKPVYTEMEIGWRADLMTNAWPRAVL